MGATAKAYLVGAGPGDPGLLTLRGKEVLSLAQVVVYDNLANSRFLEFCPREAEFVYAGKKGGEHTLSQEEINALMVQRARSGKTVVRLKGGDPYVFGRGAEEAEELIGAGIEFEVVPGVTSAVAAPAYAGIPLTHRSYASSVSFVTGHEDPSKTQSSHDWSGLARGAETLVFFMGVRNLGAIADSLREAGMPGSRPAALVRWGTTCEQQTVTGTLETIAERAEEAGLRPPALLVVGEVVRLKQRLDWFERKPLLGRGVVVTRAREQASGLLRLLEDAGACCFQFPTIAVRPLEDYSELRACVQRLRDYDWLVFTSVNGVKHFWGQLQELGLDTRALGPLSVAAIGPATAQSLRDRGVHPDFVPDKYVAESVVGGLLELGVQGRRVLIPRAEKAREVLPEELARAGAEVRVVSAYRTGTAQESGEEILEACREGRIHYITFTSSSTVENFFRLIAPEELQPFVERGLELACIGPVTGRTLEGFGFRPHLMPDDYTIPELARVLQERARGGREAAAQGRNREEGTGS